MVEHFPERGDFTSGELFQLAQAVERNLSSLIKDVVLFDRAVAAGGEVVVLGGDLVLGHPELAGELVDFFFERGDAGLKFGEPGGIHAGEAADLFGVVEFTPAAPGFGRREVRR